MMQKEIQQWVLGGGWHLFYIQIDKQALLCIEKTKDILSLLAL